MPFSAPPHLRRIALATPWTPALDRPSRTPGVEAWRSSRSSRDSVMYDRLVSGRSGRDSDASLPLLVSLAAHDLRTPLATIHGFAQTLVRMGDLGQPQQRYMETTETAEPHAAET